MDSGFLAGLPALLLAAAAIGLTAPGLDSALRREDGERLFWVSLTGGLAVVAAIAWASLAAPGAGGRVGWCARSSRNMVTSSCPVMASAFTVGSAAAILAASRRASG